MKKQELILKLEELNKEQDNIVAEILRLSEADRLGEYFNTWCKYAKKQDYCCVLDRKEAPMIRKYMNEDTPRHLVVELEWYVDLIDEEMIEEDDLEPLMRELINLNFGSMEKDW